MNFKSISFFLGLSMTVASSLMLRVIAPAQAQSNNGSDITGVSVTTSSQVSGQFIPVGNGKAVGFVSISTQTLVSLASLTSSGVQYVSNAVQTAVNNIAQTFSNAINTARSISGLQRVIGFGSVNTTFNVEPRGATNVANLITSNTRSSGRNVNVIANTPPAATAKIATNIVFAFIGTTSAAAQFMNSLLASFLGLRASTGGVNMAAQLPSPSPVLVATKALVNIAPAAVQGQMIAEETPTITEAQLNKLPSAVVSNAAILSLAMEGLTVDGRTDPSKLFIAVRAYNALVKALVEGGLPTDQPELLATRVVLSKLMEAAQTAQATPQ